MERKSKVQFFLFSLCLRCHKEASLCFFLLLLLLFSSPAISDSDKMWEGNALSIFSSEKPFFFTKKALSGWPGKVKKEEKKKKFFFLDVSPRYAYSGNPTNSYHPNLLYTETKLSFLSPERWNFLLPLSAITSAPVHEKAKIASKIFFYLDILALTKFTSNLNT